MADLKLIKAALEDAKFDDHAIRQMIYTCIDEITKDMEEISFEASIQTEKVFEELEEYVSESEEEVEEDEDEEEEDEEEVVILDDDDEE